MKEISPDSIVLCVGGGKFGTRAALQANACGATTIIIDTLQDCKANEHDNVVLTDLNNIDYSNNEIIQLVLIDGPSKIFNMVDICSPDIVVPAIPGHMMGKAASNCLQTKGFIVKNDEVAYEIALKKFPKHLVMISDSDNCVIVSSYMPPERLCIEQCIQPNVCPVTGISKPEKMYDIINRSIINCVDDCFVLRSWLISEAGGVGGIMGKDVKAMYQRIKEINKNENMAIATSCGCHGIVNFFKVFTD